jgi:hypothetical protein
MTTRQLIMRASRLRERDLALLDGLYQHRFLTRQQLQILFFTDPGSPRPAQRRLHRLRDDGLIARRALALPDGRREPEPYYCLTPDGAQLVAHRNQLPLTEARRRAADAISNPLFVRHALAGGDLHCALIRAARTEPAHRCLPEWWRGELAVEARFAENGKPTLLRPDGYTRYQAGDDIHHLLLEVDLGTMSLPRLLAKLDRYRAFSRSRSWRDRYPVFPKLLLLTTSRERVDSLCAALAPLNELVLLAATHADLRRHGALAAIWQQPDRPEPRTLLHATP